MHAVMERAAAPATSVVGTSDRWVVGGNLALVASFAGLFARALGWMGAALSGSAHAWNALLLLGVAVAVGRRDGARAFLRALPRTRPRLELLPLAILVTSVAAHVVIRRLLDIHIAGAALFGVASFALLGLYLPRPSWTRAAPAALLLVALLPFGDQADAYLGFPARLLTARGAAALLALVGVPSLDAETVLFLDNGVAHVDIPCSGLSSLWTGTLFFLGLLALEGRRLSRRNLPLLALLVGLLLGWNTLRVAIVVGLQIALHRPMLAELVHAPVGVLGFVASCALVRAAVHALDAQPGVRHATGERAPLSMRAIVGLSTLLVAATILPAAPKPSATGPASPRPLVLDGLTGEPLPLTTVESAIYERFGARLAAKRRVRIGALTATLLLVESESFRAHHPPEACLAAAGHRVEQLRTIELDAAHAYRLAALDGGQRAALFWYQSPTRTVDTLLARIVRQALDREPRWAQVTLLVDGPPGSIAREGRDLHRLVHDAVTAALDEEHE